MTYTVDWQCMACQRREHEWIGQCRYCKAKGSIEYQPMPENPNEGPTLGVHVKEIINVKPIFGRK